MMIEKRREKARDRERMFKGSREGGFKIRRKRKCGRVEGKKGLSKSTGRGRERRRRKEEGGVREGRGSTGKENKGRGKEKRGKPNWKKEETGGIRTEEGRRVQG